MKLLKSVALNTNSYVTPFEMVVEDRRWSTSHPHSRDVTANFRHFLFGAKSSEKHYPKKWAFIRSSLRRQLLTLVLLYSLVLYNTYLYQHWRDKSEKSRLISCRG